MDINTATKAELVNAVVEQGLVEFQVEAEKMSVKDLRALLNGDEIIQEPEPVKSAAPAAKGVAPAARAAKAKGDRVALLIHEQDGLAGSDDVFVGVNGRGYQIKRGVEVLVPPEVVEVLNNAIITHFEPDKDGGMRERSVRRFNFSTRAL
jgi:hypothetical protein